MSLCAENHSYHTVLFMICAFSFIRTAYCFAICSRKTLRVG
jgi:hypothetical protein